MSRQERLRNKYTEHASERDVKKITHDLPAMRRGPIAKNWQHVESLWKLIKDPTAAWQQKALAIGALVYLISPVDAIPDVIPVAGLSDDLVVILAAVATLAVALRKYAVDTAKQVTQVVAEVQVEKHYRVVTASVLGAIAIAVVAITLKITWSYLR